METKKFTYIRKKLNETQREMAEMLGISIKVVHSYEQGWPSVPGHVERQLCFLLSRMRGSHRGRKLCWFTVGQPV